MSRPAALSRAQSVDHQWDGHEDVGAQGDVQRNQKYSHVGMPRDVVSEYGLGDTNGEDLSNFRPNCDSSRLFRGTRRGGLTRITDACQLPKDAKEKAHGHL